MEHRLGTGYAQGGILSKLLVLEVYIGIIGPLLSPDMAEYPGAAIHKHIQDLPGENLFL